MFGGRVGQLVTLSVGCLIWAQAVVASDAVVLLQEMMRCRTEPRPTGTLRALLADGVLKERIGPGIDEEYCWTLSPSLHWEGMTFKAICAVTDDPAAIAENPELYWKTPFPPPFTEV